MTVAYNPQLEALSDYYRGSQPTQGTMATTAARIAPGMAQPVQPVQQTQPNAPSPVDALTNYYSQPQNPGNTWGMTQPGPTGAQQTMNDPLAEVMFNRPGGSDNPMPQTMTDPITQPSATLSGFATTPNTPAVNYMTPQMAALRQHYSRQ